MVHVYNTTTTNTTNNNDTNVRFVFSGVISRLSYFNYLNVGAIWLSPFYTSPMRDFGYDVANYTDVDPIFGNLADFDELIKTAHEKGKAQ